MVDQTRHPRRVGCLSPLHLRVSQEPQTLLQPRIVYRQLLRPPFLPEAPMPVQHRPRIQRHPDGLEDQTLLPFLVPSLQVQHQQMQQEAQTLLPPRLEALQALHHRVILEGQIRLLHQADC